MQASLDHATHARGNAVSLGPNHGYRFVGDTAILNAELAIRQSAHTGESWALQLWACDAPYQGGPLSGFKVAEAELDLPVDSDRPNVTPRLEAKAFAQPPAGQREYTMVLVLASGSPGAFDQVHDFSNYPARQGFLAPHFEGSVGYRVTGDAVTFQVERVCNPRPAGNVSGSLALELWALPAPYEGGAVEGARLAQVGLAQIAGESTEGDIERRTSFAQPPEGDWHLSLMLREWTANGYATRDFCNFAVRYQAQPRPGPAPVIELLSPASSAPSAELAPSKPAEPSAPARMSVQRATVEELAALQGLNKKLAAAIVRARPFSSLEDLLRVRGIGEKTLRRLRAFLTL